MLNVPGSNLFDTASRVICTETFIYYQHTGTSINAIGFNEPTFAAGVPCPGSVQAIGVALYKEFGLDWDKYYIQVWAAKNIVANLRGRPPDRIGWNGFLYELINQDDWNSQDGWQATIGVRVGLDPVAP